MKNFIFFLSFFFLCSLPAQADFFDSFDKVVKKTKRVNDNIDDLCDMSEQCKADRRARQQAERDEKRTQQNAVRDAQNAQKKQGSYSKEIALYQAQLEMYKSQITRANAAGDAKMASSIRSKMYRIEEQLARALVNYQYAQAGY